MLFQELSLLARAPREPRPRVFPALPAASRASSGRHK
jgi:hypothetical protein